VEKASVRRSEQTTGMKTCVVDLIKSADWGKENDGGSYQE
jgi:hypothetical protein